MKKIVNSLLCLAAITSANAMDTDVEKFNWNGIEVVWLKDNRYPTYNINIYFADGALSDKSHKGETRYMFSLIDAGTRRFSQKDIAENLDFYGVSYGGDVNHEYSTFKISGLVKDIDPTMRKICHLFADATFPKVELDNLVKKSKNEARNLSSNHSALASNAFREISLDGSPYSYPVDGKLKDWDKLNSKALKDKLNYFNKDVLKRIYLSGPKDVLSIKRIINEDCGWTGDAKKVREITYKPVQSNGIEVTLVTVPNANQAQIRMGRFLNKGEFEKRASLALSSHYLGGGFTSRLMRELRTNRGLVYSVAAYSGGQKDYGRSVISTFTKNENVMELLNVVEATLKDVKTTMDDESFDFVQNSLAGSDPFRFEKTSSYLNELMFMDHLGRPYSDVYNLQSQILKTPKDEVASTTEQIFNWNEQSIVIVGDKSLVKDLKKKFKNVKVVSYKNFL